MKVLLQVALFSSLLAVCCYAVDSGFCSFCMDVVIEMTRTMSTKDATEMGNNFCAQVTFNIERLDADCRNFVNAKLDEIKRGIIMGQNSTDICRDVKMC